MKFLKFIGIIAIVFIFWWLVFTGLEAWASSGKATLINYSSGQKQVVNLDDTNQIKTLFNFGYVLLQPDKTFLLGDTVYQSPALFETGLASGIDANASSMTLINGKTRDGQSLSGNYCFTLDSGLTNTEYMCGTATGTAFTITTRGIGSDGVTSYASLKFSHRYGADVKVTDFPQLQQQARMLNGTGTFPNTLAYNSSVSVNGASSSTLVTKGYVDTGILQGAADASNTVKGISKISSAPSVATNPIALNSEEVSTTTGASKVVRANSSGKIDSGFIDQGANYAWTGSNTWAGTSTFNGINTMSTTTFTGITKVPTSTPAVAGQVVGLDANAKLPAVDGSQLTGLGINLLLGVGNNSPKTYYQYIYPFLTYGTNIPTTNETWITTGYSSIAKMYNFFQGVAAGANIGSLRTNILYDAVGSTINIFGGSKKVIVDFHLKVNSVGTNVMGWGLTANGMTDVGWGYQDTNHPAVMFVVSSAGNLYAKTSAGTSGGSDHTETQITGITLTNINNYRIEYDPANTQALFYVNGVLKATISTTLPGASAGTFTFGQSSTTNYPVAVSAPLIAIQN